MAGCFKAKSTELTGYARLAPLRMLCPLEGTCGALLRRSLIDSPNLTTGLLEQFLYPPDLPPPLICNVAIPFDVSNDSPVVVSNL